MDQRAASTPCLAQGTELIGEYKDGGFKEPVFLVRRGDGQVIQVSRLVYWVAAEADGQKDIDRIALRVSEKFGRSVSTDNVNYLVENKLRPLGVLATTDGSSIELERAEPVLALTFRTSILPDRLVRAIAATFSPFFLPPVVIAVLAVLLVFDFWLFFVHGVVQSAQEVLYEPGLFLMLFGLEVLSGLFHEFGHAAASHYGGARPGRIGVGIYLVWPVFYSDVTDSYRLTRIDRLRTDFGGLYLEIVVSLAIVGAYFLTGFEPLLLAVLINQAQMLYQFFPFVRFDGYYMVSDLTGIPDLFGRIKPILKSLMPGQAPDRRVTELKPWVRVVVTAWVLTVIPALLYLFAQLVLNTPLLFATTRDSLSFHYDELRGAAIDGRVIVGVAELLQIVLLVIPMAGVILMLALVGKRLGSVLFKALSRKDDRLVRNETLVGLYLRSFYGRGNPGPANEIIAPDCTLHNSDLPGEVRGLEDVWRHIADRRNTELQDANIRLKDTKTDGDIVVVRWTSVGVPDDESANSNGGGDTSTNTISFRIANGKIAEIWEDNNALGDLQAPNNTEEGQEAPPSLRLIAGALGAYVGIPVALLYPVSLVALALQLQFSQQLGFLTAWYAASLVPNTIVWGQAITLLLIPLCASFAVALATAHFWVWRRLEVRKNMPRIVEESRRRTHRIRLSVAGVVLFLVAMAMVMLWFVPAPFFPGSASTLSLTLAVLIGWRGGTLIADDYGRYTNRPERGVLLGKHWAWRGVEQGWIYRGLSWVYLGSGFSAILCAVAVAASGQGPDLPRVMMSASGEEVEPTNQAPPLLLSHTSGYWHLLNSGESEGTKGGRIEHRTLSSVPDSEAGNVVVIDDPVADVSVNVESSREAVAWLGTTLSYELEVANNGPDAATSVELANRMPKDAALISVTTNRGTCDSKVTGDTRSVECELGGLPVEDTATVRIEMKPRAAGNLIDYAAVSSDSFDYYKENSKEASKMEVKLDTTTPEIRPTLLPLPNPRGWTDRDVVVNIEANDHAGSGVQEIVYGASGAQEIEEQTVRGTSAEIMLASEGRTTLYYSAKDAAGNTGKMASVTIGIDKTYPEVHCDEPDDLWHRMEVGIPCAANDSISGLGDLADANFVLSTGYTRGRIEDGEEGDNISTNSRDICDAAGNCNTVGPIGGIKIDKEQPAIDIVAPAADAEYKLKEQLKADYYGGVQ